VAFDIHVFLDREGNPCASVTDSDCVRSKPVFLNEKAMSLIADLAIDICGVQRDSNVFDIDTGLRRAGIFDEVE